MKNTLTMPQWLCTAAGWYHVTFGVFYLSEKFNYIDAVMYPAVFILIFLMMLGPGTVALLCPPPKTEKGAALRAWLPLIAYALGWGSMWLTSRIFFLAGLL